MIFDQLANAADYYSYSENLKRGLRYLAETDLAALEPGQHEIDGDEVFAIVANYQTKAVADAFWEAHEEYLDIQCVIAGRELIGYAPLDSLTVTEHNQESDFLKLEGEGRFLELRPGDFAVLAPQDAHMPGIMIGDSPESVAKIVIKVRR